MLVWITHDSKVSNVFDYDAALYYCKSPYLWFKNRSDFDGLFYVGY